MFKVWLIRFVFDAFTNELEKASKRSSNNLDDNLVKAVKDSKPDIIAMLKHRK